MSKGLGKTQQKILLLLLAGIALGLTRSPRQQFKIIKAARRDWALIDNPNGKESLRSLYRRGLLEEIKQSDGTIRITLTAAGKKQAEMYSIDTIKISKRKMIAWDGKWRIVMFDIPEKYKKERDALRFHIRRLGFKELQKSVFIFPFDALNELQKITDFYSARRHIRFVIADSVDNEYKLLSHFKLRR